MPTCSASWTGRVSAGFQPNLAQLSGAAPRQIPATTPRQLRVSRQLSVDGVEPVLQRLLGRRGIQVVAKYVRAHPDDAPVVVAAEEAIQGVAGPDANELGREIVDHAEERACSAQVGVYGIPDRRIGADAKRRPQRVHGVWGTGLLRPLDPGRRLPDVRNTAAVEVLQVLAQ